MFLKLGDRDVAYRARFEISPLLSYSSLLPIARRTTFESLLVTSARSPQSIDGCGCLSRQMHPNGVGEFGIRDPPSRDSRQPLTARAIKGCLLLSG